MNSAIVFRREVGIIMRNRSTISSNDSVITDEEEDSIASPIRNKRKRNHNQTRCRLLANRQQTDSKAMKMMKTTVTNIRHKGMESTVRKESRNVVKSYNYHMSYIH